MKNMIKTAILHALFALGIQFALAPLIGYLGGAIAGCIYYLGREVAQHEYKGGGPKVVKWYYGFINHWNTDSVLDMVFPIVATGVICYLFM